MNAQEDRWRDSFEFPLTPVSGHRFDYIGPVFTDIFRDPGNTIVLGLIAGVLIVLFFSGWIGDWNPYLINDRALPILNWR